MIITIASFSAREKDWGTAENQERWMINQSLSGRLLSYYAIAFNQAESRRSFNFYKNEREFVMENECSIFLDSGAFSAWSKGVKIDIDEYISFIKQHQEYLTYYAVLDVIGDPDKTYENQKYMEKQGVSPIPCYHYGEDVSWLKRYLNEGHEFIALGGMVPISTRDLLSWLDNLFSQYLTDEEGLPKVKIHGFGMTSLKLMLRYPWYSVDSTSWVLTGRFGSVFVPKWSGGEYVYDEDSWKVCVSIKSPSIRDAGKHFSTFGPDSQEKILQYFDMKGYKVGKSVVNEKGEIEDIESGLCNDYKQRDELNIIYFLDLEKHIPEWPWPFKITTKKRMGLM